MATSFQVTGYFKRTAPDDPKMTLNKMSKVPQNYPPESTCIPGLKTKGPWALNCHFACGTCLTTCHDIELSFMLNGHVAEVMLFLRCKFIYIHLFHCMIKTQNDLEHLKGQRFPPFLPQLGEIDFIFALWAAVSEICDDFQNCHIWGMKLCHWTKFQKLHIYCLSTPGGRNRAYFCSVGSGFRDTGRFSKLPYLGMKTGS